MSQQSPLPLFDKLPFDRLPESPVAPASAESVSEATPQVEDGERLQPVDMAPMLRQYLQVQHDHPEHLIFFQVGDFYEVFFESAITVAEVLNIRLTSRDKHADNPIPMCGVPIRAFESYLPKILLAGYRAVVVSQVEDGKRNPKNGKLKAVRREITRIVTPGVRLEEGLNERSSNFCAAAVFIPDGGAVVAFDISTGQLKIKECETREELVDAVERLRVSEIILPSTINDRPVKNEKWLSELRARLNESQTAIISRAFSDLSTAEEFFPQSKDLARPIRAALGTLFTYVREVSCGRLHGVSCYSIEKAGLGSLIDSSTVRNLEVLETRIDGDKKYSVFSKIDRTRTAMGSRLLQDWLISSRPELDEVQARHGLVGELCDKSSLLADLRNSLGSVKDLERLVSKVQAFRSSPQEIAIIRDSLAVIPAISNLLESLQEPLAGDLRTRLPQLVELRDLLSEALVQDPPYRLGERPCFQPRYHYELRKLYELTTDVGQRLLELETKERARSGIANLRIKQAAGFGYCYEVSRANASKVPVDYERRQTLTNVERFVTPELKAFEIEIFAAEENHAQLERELFQELQSKVASFAQQIQTAAQVLSELDVLCAFAELAVEQNYVRPEMTEGEELCIEGGRHPVIEQVIGQTNFVANDARLDGDKRRFAVLTGPNMGGKSTYLRQIGLIQLMAQMGSFVPARRATLGMVDRIFTRIGASDDLSRGESTFMVEMRETSTILRRASRKSLVLIDEVGRGTATSDGRAIALAVSDYLLDAVGCRTVFATHFHELTTALEREGVFFLAVGVEEIGSEISLTHRILEQIGDKSYGIEVAKLAGLPSSVIERAQHYLSFSDSETLVTDLSEGSVRNETLAPLVPVPLNKEASVYEPILKEIAGLELESLTPIEAMIFLNTLKGRLAKVTQ